MASIGKNRSKRIRNSALLFAAIAFAFYAGFILLGVLRA
jgi:hypothetical protein